MMSTAWARSEGSIDRERLWAEKRMQDPPVAGVLGWIERERHQRQWAAHHRRMPSMRREDVRIAQCCKYILYVE